MLAAAAASALASVAAGWADLADLASPLAVALILSGSARNLSQLVLVERSEKTRHYSPTG